MKETIATFFRVYQTAIDFYWSNVIYYYSKTNEEMGKKFILKWNIDKITDQAAETSLLESIHIHSNIKLAPQIIPEYYFLPTIKRTKKAIIFGTSSNGYDFCMNIISSKISLIDYDHQTLYFNIAESEEAFLKVLVKLCEFQILFLRKITVDAEISSKFRKEIIGLAGGEEYSKFYNYTVISENDQPVDPFIL